MPKPESNFSNFDKNNRTERPSFSNKPRGGFGEKMGMSNMSNQQNGSNNSSRRGFGQREYNHNEHQHEHKENRQLNTQAGREWIETSEFTRTNVLTGEVAWKEELYSNRSPNVHIVEPKIDGMLPSGGFLPKEDQERGLGFSVPSTWKFQNCTPGNYVAKDGTVFKYEFTAKLYDKTFPKSAEVRLLHNKERENARLNAIKRDEMLQRRRETKEKYRKRLANRRKAQRRREKKALELKKALESKNTENQKMAK